MFFIKLTIDIKDKVMDHQKQHNPSIGDCKYFAPLYSITGYQSIMCLRLKFALKFWLKKWGWIHETRRY